MDEGDKPEVGFGVGFSEPLELQHETETAIDLSRVLKIIFSLMQRALSVW
ncbi:hypothetical protein Pan241w_29850 [Gimesia alba]|uniref:Uncharacterized protein n=1 Tax=Gimesia alba TaxID=2527973 RepID=A0A517RG97_9PLAN|nr:hypothetical protein Pan241w_29850 [Gimesia alba]